MEPIFTVNELYTLDLKDDFIMNDNLKLYEFLGNDPTKAFHLGVHVVKWFNLLEKNQKYLYSKDLRHISEEIRDYSEQLQYWSKSFSKGKDEVDIIELSEYIFNNIIWDIETENTDKTKVALFLGMIAGKNTNLDEESDEKLIYSVY